MWVPSRLLCNETSLDTWWMLSDCEILAAVPTGDKLMTSPVLKKISCFGKVEKNLFWMMYLPSLTPGYLNGKSPLWRVDSFDDARFPVCEARLKRCLWPQTEGVGAIVALTRRWTWRLPYRRIPSPILTQQKKRSCVLLRNVSNAWRCCNLNLLALTVRSVEANVQGRGGIKDERKAER